MTSKKPNFLIIVADDLGYSDVGPFGGEINTPALDQLARDGIRMSNFHMASACSPTRSMLLSGTDNQIAGLGQMAEWMRAKRAFFDDKPGYEGYLNWRVAALSEILADSGYLTIHSGKWHLGMTEDVAPANRGFQKSFVFMPGSGNHYAFWMENGKFIDPRTDLPKDLYSSKGFTDKLIEYLDGRDVTEKEKPFFAYLAYTAPHWPLQAPKEVIDKYAGVYDDGPDALTLKRLARLQQLGLVKEGVDFAPPVGLLGKEWTHLSDEEQKVAAKKMQVFAAMVEVMDENIGRMVDYLRSIGELDNTFILFMSDNGAEGGTLEALPIMGSAKTMGDIINKYYDNSTENMGAYNSFINYGPRWACAASAPSRGAKSWITEGGIKCPCLIRYPPFRAKEKTLTHAFTTVMDILPTVLDLAGVPHPGTEFRGRQVVTPRGKPWTGHLKSLGDNDGIAETSVHGEDSYVNGWELFGERAIREGPWKALWMPAPKGKNDWELYNLDDDPAELKDLSAKEPELLDRLVKHWEVYFAETGMVDVPANWGTWKKV